MKSLCFIIMFGIILFGCVPKPIDIDVKAAKPKLVLASQIIPNQIMIISLTRSFSALEGKGIQDDDSLNNDFLKKILVENAFVTVTYFGITDTLFMINPGIYASINTLQYEYGNYSIFARDPQTGEEINAITQLIPQAKFDTIYPQVIKNPGDTIVKINFTLKDNPATEDYYVINYIRKTKNNSPIDINRVFSQGKNRVAKEFQLLDDNSFSNNIYSTSKKLDEATYHDSIAVILSHVTKGYFEFLNAFKKSGALINQLTGEPINYPTNVNNGYGYFNAYFPTTRIYDLNKY